MSVNPLFLAKKQTTRLRDRSVDFFQTTSNLLRQEVKTFMRVSGWPFGVHVLWRVRTRHADQPPNKVDMTVFPLPPHQKVILHQPSPFYMSLTSCERKKVARSL